MERNRRDLNNRPGLPPHLTNGKFHPERGPGICPRSSVAYWGMTNNNSHSLDGDLTHIGLQLGFGLGRKGLVKFPFLALG